MTNEQAIPVAWMDGTGGLHNAPRRAILGLWDESCGSAEALGYAYTLDEAAAKWRELVEDGEREVHLTGYGCGILAQHEEMDWKFGKPTDSSACPICKRDTPHQHAAQEAANQRDLEQWRQERMVKQWEEIAKRIAGLEALYPWRTPLYVHPAGSMDEAQLVERLKAAGYKPEPGGFLWVFSTHDLLAIVRSLGMSPGCDHA